MSTISTHMANLESRVGLTLCRRGRGGFALSERGRLFYDATVRLLNNLEGFLSEVGELQGKMVGEIRLGIVDNLVETPDCRLAEAIGCFNEKAPDVHITIHFVSPERTESWLLGGRVHLAVIGAGPLSPAIQSHKLYLERQDLYCGQAHPLFEVPDEEIDQDRIKHLAYVRRGYSVLAPYDDSFAGPASATVYTIEGVAHLVLSGRFVGYLPHYYAAHWQATGQMRALRPDLTGLVNPIIVAYARQLPLTKPAVGFLREILAIHGSDDRRVANVP